MTDACEGNWVKAHDEGFYVALGERIAELRAARGLTQHQLADALGISQRTVASYEVGRIRLQIAGLPALADALGVSMQHLLAPLARYRRPKARRNS